MPKDPPNNAGSNSRYMPYPSLFSTQDGRIGVPRGGLRNPSYLTWPISPRSSGVGIAPEVNSATLTAVSPHYHQFTRLPSVQGESLVHTTLPGPLGQRGPLYPNPIGSLSLPPPQAQDLTRSPPSPGIEQRAMAQLQASRHGTMVERPTSHPQFAPWSMVEPSPPNPYPPPPPLPTRPLQTPSRIQGRNEQTARFMSHGLPPRLPPSRSQQTLSEMAPIPQASSTDAARPNRSIFQCAQNIQVGNLQFIDANNAIIHPQSEEIDGWKLLLEHTAPNALHNSRARYDAPKCDEDTRVGVTNEITTFLEDRDGAQRLLCMTGAAGSGKSALQQTVAEICGRKNILGSAFFFLAVDASRNTVDPVIPTIAYELGTRNSEVRSSIKSVVENDPLIFKKTLRDQISTLIVRPFEHLARRGSDLRALPHIILIDGLDECTNEDHQAELLAAITQCLLVDHLPFRIFIASRPEWAIRTALQRGGYLHTLAYQIQLSDDYDASGDMCRYLQRRFHALSSRTGNPHWFAQHDIDTLVSAASGQFVYVAVAFNYISERRGSPAERLKIILTWTPRQGGTTRPFEALDILYSNILSTARAAYESLDTNGDRDFLLLFTTYHNNTVSHRRSVALPYWFSHERLSKLLGLEATDKENLFSDLRSLLTLDRDSSGSLKLRLYHKSFSDFLQEEGRAEGLFVPRPRICSHIAKCCMQTILEHGPVLYPPDDLFEALPFFLNVASVGGAVGIDDEAAEFARKGGWHIIDQYFSMLLPGFLGDINPWLFPDWINTCRGAVDHLTPEAGEPLRELVEKWEVIYRQSPRSKMFGLTEQPADFSTFVSQTNTT